MSSGHRLAGLAARRECDTGALPPDATRSRIAIKPAAAGYNEPVDAVLVERLDSALPQTQCTRCGYEGCRPYAEAIAAGAADINRCPPGGEATIGALARIVARPPLPLDPSCGAHTALRVAVVDESRCIGCTLCIDACPVDAVVGAPKRMHTVLPQLCSGCELCVAPCPIDCIAIVDAQREWTHDDAVAARARHGARAQRLAANERIAERGIVAPRADAARLRQQAVADALARARARRAGARPPRQ